jgi:predicted RNA-binding protein YlqC (UPF0109 family)
MSDADLDADDGRPDEFNRVKAANARAELEYVAKELVDDPASVSGEAEEGRVTVLRLHAASDDLGRLIGRRGRVAQSIRTVVRAAGHREGDDVTVDIVD